MAVVLLNTALQMTTWASEPRGWHDALQYIDLIFVLIYTVEMVAKMLQERTLKCVPGLSYPLLRFRIFCTPVRLLLWGAQAVFSPAGHGIPCRRCPLVRQQIAFGVQGAPCCLGVNGKRIPMSGPCFCDCRSWAKSRWNLAEAVIVLGSIATLITKKGETREVRFLRLAAVPALMCSTG